MSFRIIVFIATISACYSQQSFVEHVRMLKDEAGSGRSSSAVALWRINEYIRSDPVLNAEFPERELIALLERAANSGDSSANLFLFRYKAEKAKTTNEFNEALKYLKKAQEENHTAKVVYAIYLAIDRGSLDEGIDILDRLAEESAKHVDAERSKGNLLVWNDYPREEIRILQKNLLRGRAGAMELTSNLENSEILNGVLIWRATSPVGKGIALSQKML